MNILIMYITLIVTFVSQRVTNFVTFRYFYKGTC